jgi:hypothetical protein
LRNVIVISALVLAAAAAAHAGNLVVDGDFSQPAGGAYSDFASIPGWTNNSGDGFELGNSGTYGLLCINTSCQSDEVNANGFDSISQTITGLVVGKTYDVSWEYGGRNGGGPQALNVSFGGSPLTTDTSDGVDAKWTQNSYVVTATSASETLTFASEVTVGDPSYGNELTNVSVVGVPEPAAWALMLVGFAGLGGALRTRRRAALV